jgi:hypothetical protein
LVFKNQNRPHRNLSLFPSLFCLLKGYAHKEFI